MTWLKAAAQEVWGLFVDDGLLAILTLAWLILFGLLLRLRPSVMVRSEWGGGVLLVGLLVILVESVVRAARRARHDRTASAKAVKGD